MAAMKTYRIVRIEAYEGHDGKTFLICPELLEVMAELESGVIYNSVISIDDLHFLYRYGFKHIGVTHGTFSGWNFASLISSILRESSGTGREPFLQYRKDKPRNVEDGEL